MKWETEGRCVHDRLLQYHRRADIEDGKKKSYNRSILVVFFGGVGLQRTAVGIDAILDGSQPVRVLAVEIREIAGGGEIMTVEYLCLD